MNDTPVCYLCSLGPAQNAHPVVWRVDCPGATVHHSVFACDIHRDAIVGIAAAGVDPEAITTDVSREVF